MQLFKLYTRRVRSSNKKWPLNIFYVCDNSVIQRAFNNSKELIDDRTL